MTPQQKVLGIILVMIAIINATLNTLSVYAITPVVSAMTDRDSFLSNNIIAIISKITGINDFSKLFLILCIMIMALYVFKEIIAIFQLWYSNKFAFKIDRETSETVLNSYMKREYDFFLDYGTSKIIRDVTGDTTSVNNMLTCLSNLATEAFTVVMIVSYVIISDIQMAMIIVVLAAICILLVYKFFKQMVVDNGIKYRIYSAEKQKTLLESVEGIKEVQVMKKQQYFLDRFHNDILNVQRPQLVQAVATSAPTYVIEGVFIAGIMAYIGIRAMYDANFFETLPVLASFLVGAIRLLPSIGRISNNMNNITFFLNALDSVYENFKKIKECEGKEAKSEVISDKKNSDSFRAFHDKLSLQGINWKYENATDDVLHDLNLIIEKGQSVGIIGHSGAGKSTLADIILGLHNPQSGSICIDGVDISDIPYEYSRVIGYVPQSVYLVDGSIRENVAFGVDASDIDDEKVWEVIKKAQLYDFVCESEHGLDTIVGERGVKFSGGQRQRLAVARALYRNPQILILDEATSALDNETEAMLMSEIEGLYGQLTMIIIAHRLTTVRKCDVVYEITGGKAVKRNKEELGI